MGGWWKDGSHAKEKHLGFGLGSQEGHMISDDEHEAKAFITLSRMLKD